MKNKKITTSGSVYHYIENKIMSREWTPGMKITSENQLSEELGVSRMSVREAIEKMVALNILTRKPGEGTFVDELSSSMYINKLLSMVLLEEDNLIDLLEFRKTLEVDSAMLCAERCDEDTLKLLDQCYDNMCRHKDISSEFVNFDFEFHDLIVKGTGNSIIIKVNSILSDVWRFQQKKINKYLGSSGGIKEHKKILEAIKNKDVEISGIYMKRHIERIIDDVKAIDFTQIDKTKISDNLVD